MADEADYANEQAERWLKQSLENRNTSKRLAPKGACYFCEAEFDKETDAEYARRLFCDKDCADDFEYEERLKNRR